MDSTCTLILESLNKMPIGKTDHFTWFITDIGIVALFDKAKDFEFYNLNVEKEALQIALDISKEEKEYLEIYEKRVFLFYS